MADEGYPKDARSTSNRLKARAKYDYETIHSIIDQTPVLHISFPSSHDPLDPFPAILPMLGVTGSFPPPSIDSSHDAPGSFPSEAPPPDLNAPRTIYLHGYVSSRLIKAPSADGAPSQGTPVAVAATLMDGLVLSYTPFHHSCNYRSAVAHGYASIVTDEAERMYALELITNNMLPQRWENSRVPPTKAELTSTGVLRVDIESASAKVRVGGPSEDRHDLKNQEMKEVVWAGTIPTWSMMGEPVQSKDNIVREVPAYISRWITQQNEQAGRHAKEAIQKGE